MPFCRLLILFRPPQEEEVNQESCIGNLRGRPRRWTAFHDAVQRRRRTVESDRVDDLESVCVGGFGDGFTRVGP